MEPSPCNGGPCVCFAKADVAHTWSNRFVLPPDSSCLAYHDCCLWACSCLSQRYSALRTPGRSQTELVRGDTAGRGAGAANDPAECVLQAGAGGEADGGR